MCCYRLLGWLCAPLWGLWFGNSFIILGKREQHSQIIAAPAWTVQCLVLSSVYRDDAWWDWRATDSVRIYTYGTEAQRD